MKGSSAGEPAAQRIQITGEFTVVFITIIVGVGNENLQLIDIMKSHTN